MKCDLAFYFESFPTHALVERGFFSILTHDSIISNLLPKVSKNG